MARTHYLLTGSSSANGGTAKRIYFIPTLTERKEYGKLFDKMTKGTPPRTGLTTLRMQADDHLASGGVLPTSEIHICNSYAEALATKNA